MLKMTLRVSNFGPIANAEFNFSRISVLTGRNSTGKSMVLRLLWAVIESYKKLLEDSVVNVMFSYYLAESVLAKALEGFRGSKRIDLTEDFFSSLQKYISSDRVSKIFSRILAGELRDIFNVNDLRELVKFGAGEARFYARVGGFAVEGSVDSVVRAQPAIYREAFNQLGVLIAEAEYLLGAPAIVVEDKLLRRRLLYPITRTTEDSIRSGLEFSASAIVKILVKRLPEINFIIDARERVNLFLNVIQTAFMLSEGKEISGAIPGDLWRYLKDVQSFKKAGISLPEELQDFMKKHFSLTLTYANELKEYYFMVPETVRGGEGVIMPVEKASSGAKEIYTLLLALARRYPQSGRGKATRHGGGVIIVEEPEAHLHPGAVIDLIRIFARIVNRNRDSAIIVSTHSDWVIYALNELIIASSVPERAKSLGIPEESLIKPEDVAVYLLRRGESGSVAERIEVDEGGIGDTEFSKVLEELYDRMAGLTVASTYGAGSREEAEKAEGELHAAE